MFSSYQTRNASDKAGLGIRIVGQARAAFWLVLPLALLWGGQAMALDCPPLEMNEPAAAEIEPRHARGLLWEINRAGLAPSYLFGTVHVSDPRVIDLPDPVVEALERTDLFIMEALLDGPSVAEFGRELFSGDGTRLSDLLPPAYYTHAVEILANYNIPSSTVDNMKPWAAFLTMNMPPDTGIPMDIVLMNRAGAQGSRIYGLESLAEQAAVFDVLDEAQHIQMLKDSICYYDVLQADMEDMIRLYLERDLAGLFAYRDRYHLHTDATYQRFIQSILWDRNVHMADRMQSYLEQGNAFIAIGALHLPGEQGVLGLLEQAGYQVRPIY
jgi:uncharacterized protein